MKKLPLLFYMLVSMVATSCMYSDNNINLSYTNSDHYYSMKAKFSKSKTRDVEEYLNQKKDTRFATIAQKYGATEAQINIAWLLHRSRGMLPIPCTSSLKHFEENLQATDIELSEEDMAFLE